VTAHQHGTKQFHLAGFGELTLNNHVLALAAVPGLSMVDYTAEPNSVAAQIIELIAEEILRTARCAPGTTPPAVARSSARRPASTGAPPP
jgi:hypothetical protein